MGTSTELLETFKAQYKQAGMYAEMIPKGNPETPDQGPGLRLDGKIFDIVQADIPMYREGGEIEFGGGAGASSQTQKRKCNFSYLIQGKLKKSPAEIATQLTGETKGLFKKKLVSVSWSGGLAQDFTKDKKLHSLLLANGIDNIKIEALPQFNCVRITHGHSISIVKKSGGVVVKVAKYSYKNLLPMNKITVLEQIGNHIKTNYMQ